MTVYNLTNINIYKDRPRYNKKDGKEKVDEEGKGRGRRYERRLRKLKLIITC